MQKILEAKDHEARCKLLKFFIDAERKRLSTKKSLKGMFSSDGTSDVDLAALESAMPDEERIVGDESPINPRSIMTDEPDAFQ